MPQDPHHSSELDPRMREAFAWIARLTSGEASTEDAERLMAWRRSSPNNELAYQEAARLWKASGPALAPAAAESRSGVTRRRFLRGGAMAASVAGAAVAGSYLGLLPTFEALAADYATGVGEQRRVTLEDATLVDLDGGSSLSVDFSMRERGVSLETGAALFDVSANQPRPFVVSADDGRIAGRETVFSVTRSGGQVRVACLEGEVQVSCRGEEAALGPGEGLGYSVEGLGGKSSVPLDSIGAWRRGLLIFQDRPLTEVVNDINRHRFGRVILANEQLARRRVTGVFHLDRPDEALAHLKATLQLSEASLAGVVVFY